MASYQAYNTELERHYLSALIKHPDQWGEVAAFSDSGDFSKIHRPFFDIIKFQLEQTPRGSISPVVLADLIKKYNVTLEGISPYEYLQSMEIVPTNEKNVGEFAKELKRHTVRRELVKKCNEALEGLKDSQDKTAGEMIDIVDKTLTDINTTYFQQETEEIFSSLIEVVEERGNNPIDASQIGFMGPFDSINKTIGSLSYPSAFTVVGARTANGKSSLGFFHNTYVAERYEVPVLHLDAGEMTPKDLQMRAVCALSAGRVPLYMVKSGEWRKSKELTDIIRGEIWPRVAKIKTYYQNISKMSPKEFVSFIKRFYYNKVGRNNHLLIHWDYIKGLEAVGKNSSEHQSIGYMIGDLKSLITEQGGITASVWTSVQNNKMGIYNGKSASDIVDSEESMSLSDRIIQQATNAFTMRFKIPEEILREGSAFGNVMLKSTKERELLGKNYQDMLTPVKMKLAGSQGAKPVYKMLKNYFNIQSTNFSYFDKGDLRGMVEALGQAPVKLDEKSQEKFI